LINFHFLDIINLKTTCKLKKEAKKPVSSYLILNLLFLTLKLDWCEISRYTKANKPIHYGDK